MTVLLVIVDGLRPDAIHAGPFDTLQSLLRRGAYSLSARTVMPCITLPCHMSICHSVPPTRHGVTTNDWQPLARPLPGLVDVARSAGRRCSFFYGWEPLRNLSQPLSLYSSWFQDVAEDLTVDGDRIIATAAARAIVAERPDFAFVYLGNVDTAGHQYGWMSDGYLAQVGHVDEVLSEFFDALGNLSYTLCLQADHGGHDRHHGLDIPGDMHVPWVRSGPGSAAGGVRPAPVRVVVTAATLARLLDIKPAPQWEGRVVEEAWA